ncbi:GntR family transcriptional regulator [Mycobacterium shimoidei]|uniref:Putative transcriptional regulatory protein Mce1R (Probably GntR-family) [Mycobacterium tuberculosis H37Rv] n=1 Tax=Mycobacterium shimoidei TaxID=29313 RepID=A0A1E3TLW6_MYCSH|nr:GntR family transcriptional regulator [Mycobacterium shimoidei]MCV7258618.1 GntR family transcriptional regulator [Mycobacterium shimoidei]ODR15448.1 GntR family transcriptional regulator [Mycobacterium shimoidei]ORW80024.1 GntR family transcriptional regulator [Mycobacterium shimoidei]SRX92678.1 putative transcriptional regulatory protein Mce1R (probably GntR-family) [Mycobacterium tuberculosis H37Rv] [Mycobacterium shimoidei]
MNAPISVQPDIRPPLRRAQLSDEVAGHLRAEIMSGALRPGMFIRLDETAAKLGVSITPVREALLKLRGEGMVQLEPHRGHVVSPLSRRDIDDIFWLQATLAKELAATATEHITDADIDELEHINTALAAAVASADIDAIVTLEFAFHRAFNRAAGRIKLAWFLLHVARYMPLRVYAADPGWGQAAVDNHRRLIAALRRRDTAAVVEHTNWQFVDGARRLTERLDSSGIWD